MTSKGWCVHRCLSVCMHVTADTCTSLKWVQWSCRLAQAVDNSLLRNQQKLRNLIATFQRITTALRGRGERREREGGGSYCSHNPSAFRCQSVDGATTAKRQHINCWLVTSWQRCLSAVLPADSQSDTQWPGTVHSSHLTLIRHHHSNVIVVSYQPETSCARGRHNMPPPPASWPLTFSLWKWCPSHVWRGLPPCQF